MWKLCEANPSVFARILQVNTGCFGLMKHDYAVPALFVFQVQDRIAVIHLHQNSNAALIVYQLKSLGTNGVDRLLIIGPLVAVLEPPVSQPLSTGG